VLLIDLDGFKPINDRYGHAAGDELLTALAARLPGCVRTGDTVGRLGGDEFAVVLPDVTDSLFAVRVADAIIAACAEPFTVAGHEVLVGASVGVGVGAAEEPLTGRELLRRADVAMYRAKQHAAGHAYLYDLAMEIDPGSVPEPTTMPGLSAAELAELDRMHSRIAELERKGLGVTTEPVSR
jgi:diguanylate cyclase (GGDEF)-like protein